VKRVELLVATKNAKKLSEIRELLRGLPVKLTSLADYPRAPPYNRERRYFRREREKEGVEDSGFQRKTDRRRGFRVVRGRP